MSLLALMNKNYGKSQDPSKQVYEVLILYQDVFLLRRVYSTYQGYV